jgi:hypothetical protein
MYVKHSYPDLLTFMQTILDNICNLAKLSGRELGMCMHN